MECLCIVKSWTKSGCVWGEHVIYKQNKLEVSVSKARDMEDRFRKQACISKDVVCNNNRVKEEQISEQSKEGRTLACTTL